jgi:hypothetical protein
VLKPNFNSWNIKSNSEFEFQKQTVKPSEVHYKRIPNICREKKRKKKRKRKRKKQSHLETEISFTCQKLWSIKMIQGRMQQENGCANTQQLSKAQSLLIC